MLSVWFYYGVRGKNQTSNYDRRRRVEPLALVTNSSISPSEQLSVLPLPGATAMDSDP